MEKASHDELHTLGLANAFNLHVELSQLITQLLMLGHGRGLNIVESSRQTKTDDFCIIIKVHYFAIETTLPKLYRWNLQARKVACPRSRKLLCSEKDYFYTHKLNWKLLEMLRSLAGCWHRWCAFENIFPCWIYASCFGYTIKFAFSCSHLGEF